jgi:hypothetical protein
MSTVGTYEMTWSPDELPADLLREATTQMSDRLADLGYLPSGPVTIRLSATVSAVLHDDGPDEPLPWESREGYAAEMFDRLAA